LLFWLLSAVFVCSGQTPERKATLRALISAAYHVAPYRIVNGPAWIDSDEWRVGGEALERRFQLVVQRQSRSTSVYDLIRADGGLKLTPSTCPANCGRFVISRGRIQGLGVHLQPFADLISDMLGRPVIDRTGFTGPVDLQLDFLPDDAVDATGPDASLVYLLEDKLGLRLKASYADIEMLVIEHVEKPAK
jgi:uncharacterized protein (TIGR03435 family)